MKYRKTILSLLAVAACAVYAAKVNDGRNANGEEKVKPAAAMPSASVQSRAYPALSLAGSADGVPYGLRLMDVNDRQVSLSWLSPEETDGYFDDFESHDDFTLNSPGSIGWTYIDADNALTYTWQACTFANMGQRMAFIVMNPSATSPAVDTNPNYIPYSGSKMLVDFCAVGTANNDYLISPELNFDTDFHVSFMARSYTEAYGLERVRVGYSTTGTRPSDFTFVNEGEYIEVPAEWTLIDYTIPQDAKYVTINCVSADAFMLLIDDVFVGTNAVRPGIAPKRAASAGRLQGFNVYRDGRKVNDGLVTLVRYTDTVADYGTYSYTVTAVYADGTESEACQPLTVEVPDIRLLPFEDDFSSWTLDTDNWTTVNHDGNTQSYWGIDYYSSGLVDPCATYTYSAISNYSQSLMTRELNTPDVGATYLRFNLRLNNYVTRNRDFLAVEITDDGGLTWKSVDTFNNMMGSFDWRICQYNIGSQLDSNLFRIRFRAYGTLANYIDYWYVDDVKVWTPVWTTASMTVTSADGIISGCPVTLTGESGAVVNATTDASGCIAFNKIEADTYAVEIVRDGCNVYTGTWTIEADAANETTITLTRPVVSLSSTGVSAEIAAEDTVVKTMTLANTGDGTMTWYIDNMPPTGSGDASRLWEVQGSFNASGDLQSTVAFDGENYYTSSYTELGEFWKYDKDGRLIENFRLPDMYSPVYDLTYDGRYFYGADGNNHIYKFDFYNRRVADIITVASEDDLEITHCCYDPDRDGFWIGGWNTIALVDGEGKFKTLLSNFDSNTTLSVIGSAYDNTTPGGPYLWLADGITPDIMLDCVRIYQYSLSTRRLTGVAHFATDVPGYKIGDSASGVNRLGGLSSSFDINNGTLTLTGVLQQSPSLIFNYTLCETDNWAVISPKHGTLAPGEEQEISVLFNSIDAVKGDELNSTATVHTIPELAGQSFTVSMSVNADAAYPRPVGLTAAADTASVCLAWRAGNSARLPQGYNVYRNGSKINAELVADTAFVDNRLVYGEYYYKVSAVYGDGTESLMSDSVAAFVKNGAQYYAPLSPVATVSGNRNVSLTWLSPLANAAKRDTASWSTCVHADELGISGGGYFYAASVWSAEDLVPYRNKKVASVSVQLVNPCGYLALSVLKDGQQIYSKVYSGNILYDGTFTDVTVDEPVTIEPGAEYYFVFRIMNASGSMPLALDASPAVNGKGNMLSMDGETWMPATYQGIAGNFNIKVNMEPAETTSEEEPSGYNVYRDGHLLTAEPVAATAYEDVVDEAGVHRYTLTSVYSDGGESAFSDAAEAEIIAVGERIAPSEINSDIHMNRNVSLRWDYPTALSADFKADIVTRPVTTDAALPDYHSSFVGHDNDTEMGIASDNNFIYTSTFAVDGRINKYSMAGEYLETFVLDGVEGIRNIAYDGEYFYVGDYSTNIYKVDMAAKTVLETIGISEYSRHLAYIPELDGGNGGFEVGDWETSIYVAKDGSKLGDGPALLGAAGTAYHNGKLYAFEQGGENTRTIGIYDYSTSQRIGSVDVSAYSELGDLSTASAGGMSVVSRPDGSSFLAMALQRTDGTTKFAFIELSTVSGVSGYNVYRDNNKMNEEPLTHRYFAETIEQDGRYEYAIETVYIDGTVSPKSSPVIVEIQPKGIAPVPANVKAVQSTYGYNVLLSFADPDMYASAASSENFEASEAQVPTAVEGWINRNSAWVTTADYAYDGVKSMLADAGVEATMFIPVDGMRLLKMAVRNADDHNGHGSISILRSVGGADEADLVAFETYETNEAWTEVECEIPDGTEYIAIRKTASEAAQIIDAVRLYTSEPQQTVYSYDVFRDGVQVNSSPIEGISYIDRNLQQGRYDYQVRLTTTLSAVSELSEKVTIDLDYDNGGLAPTALKAALQDDGSVKLNWKSPALGEPVYLRWHDGKCYDAGGLSNGGAFFAGARWSATDLQGYTSLALTDVEFYINQIPDALFVLVYEGNTLVRRQYVPTLTQYSFNNVKLDEPLTIDATKDIIVALYVEHNEISVPLGYDKGPAVEGKGNLYSSDGVTWSLMSDDDTGIDANWNISIGLSPYSNTPLTPNVAKAARHTAFAPKQGDGALVFKSSAVGSAASSAKNAFLGYNVYRNKARINAEAVVDTAYIDASPSSVKYLEYQVSAVYSASGESYSPSVIITTNGIDGVETDGNLRITVENGDFHVFELRVGTPVTLYDVNGSLLYKSVAKEAYEHVIPASGMARGTYVLTLGDASYKIVK